MNTQIFETFKIIDEIFKPSKEYRIKNIMKKQQEFCNKNNLPMFAPYNGICWHCQMVINDNGEELITKCNNCHTSFIE